MRRPRLTEKELRGLVSLAAFVEAGSCVDITGYEWESLGDEGKQNWVDIESACQWIRKTQSASNKTGEK